MTDVSARNMHPQSPEKQGRGLVEGPFPATLAAPDPDREAWCSWITLRRRARYHARDTEANYLAPCHGQVET